MAIMYPNNIESYNYTQSEKFFYNLLKEQLSDEFKVFYSIRWFKNVNGQKESSECDFLIFNPKYGYITIEVKGGVSIKVEDGEWRILDSNASNSYRVLRRSPFKQAEESMYYFKDYYEDQFASFYKGTYGFAVALPFYSVERDMFIGYPKMLILDRNSINDLENNIIEIFKYWRGKYHNYLPFSYEQQVKFINVLNKRISLSAAAGALIDMRQRELDKTNRIQDNYIEFISNYKKAFIIGGAGTGKTWIGIKKAIKEFEKGRRVLIVTPSELLAMYIRNKIKETGIEVRCFYDILECCIKKYDCIIVDEAQDFNEQQAEFICGLLEKKEQSVLYVMYDENQRIYDVDFRDKFKIEYPSFLLNENIRNTAAIYDWCVKETGIGEKIRTCIIEGVIPEKSIFKNKKIAIKKLESLLNTLIVKECVSNKSIVILSDRRYEDSMLNEYDKLGRYKFVTNNININNDEISFSVDKEFKGLESDIVIYLQHNTKKRNFTCEYISYTRPRFYLYVIKLDT